MVAHVTNPSLTNPELALPTVLTDLPVILGSIGLAAVLSAELSSADPVRDRWESQFKIDPLDVPLEDKPYDVPYWDITSKREQAMLEPILAHVAGTGAYVYFRKEGEGVTSHYHMRVDPA